MAWPLVTQHSKAIEGVDSKFLCNLIQYPHKYKSVTYTAINLFKASLGCVERYFTSSHVWICLR